MESDTSVAPQLMRKFTNLRETLRRWGSVAVAYSGGLDSTFLMAAAHRELGPRALALTATGVFYSAEESERAREIARTRGWRHRTVPVDPLADPAIICNPPDRCYHCKRLVFDRLRAVATEEGVEHLAEGTTVDDLNDYRPGMKAVKEAGVFSPLLEAGFEKEEVRTLSCEMDLPTALLPANACLASRIPYGRVLTSGDLDQVAAAEEALHRLGFPHCRVRHHEATARIEVPLEEIPALAGEKRSLVAEALRAAGFRYVALDLDGYRTGSMNETIRVTEKKEERR